MKKKFVSLLLCLSVAVGAFGGCFNGLGGLNSSQADGEKSEEDISVSMETDSSQDSLEDSSQESSKDSSEDSSQDSSKDSFEDSSQDSSEDSSDNSSDSAEETAHKDANDDGKCDICAQTVAFTFDIFALNDLHGKFEDTDAQPGVDELSTYFTQTRERNENTILLSTGDMWQGSPESNVTKGAIITDWMNAMNFVSMTLGNHEYDWGEEYIKKNQQIANFPFLALNVYDKFTNERVDYCQPSVLVEQKGVKIGIIGAMGDCYSSISAEQVAGVTFKVGSELTALVKAESNKLRSEGADFIVYSIHDDSTAYDEVLSKDGYVDLVFEGHTHQSYGKKDAYGVYHLQNGGDNKGVSHAEVKINYVTGTTAVLKAEYVATSVYQSYEDHPIVDELMEKYKDEVAIAYEALGKNDKTLYADEILSVCARLYYEAGAEKWRDKEIVLGGAYMKLRAPYQLNAGMVVYGDLMNILPFDNRIVLCRILGKNLKNTFFASRDNYYVYCKEGFEESKIADNTYYYVITDSYTSQYAYNRLEELETYDEKVFPRDLYAQYIREGNLTVDLSKITLTDIPTLNAIGKNLAANVETSEKYFVKAKIKSVDRADYGNLTLEDEQGNTLYIYGTKDQKGNYYGKMDNPPKVGDTVLLEGSMYNYKGTKAEMKDAILWQVE